MSQQLPNSFLQSLDQDFRKNFYSQEPDQVRHFDQDWTQGYWGNSRLVVFPETTEEVSKFLSLCHQHRLCVVPSGGRTGLAAGATATQGEIILSMVRMNQIRDLNRINESVRVQAGVINQSLQNFLEPQNLHWPIELASKGSCTIGGNIATNAGGIRVIRYGHTRKWIQSLEIVLMNGEILELNGELEKNNTGYALQEILVGSEGTLAVITEATLKLAPVEKERSTFLFKTDSLRSIFSVLEFLKTKNESILAFEVFAQNCLHCVLEQNSYPAPFVTEGEWNLLIELSGEPSADKPNLWDEFLEKIFKENWVQEGRMAQTSVEQKQFWSYRENITESLSTGSQIFKNDLALPLNHFENFMKELRSLTPIIYPNFEVFLFGHFGDGNVHVNVRSKNLDQKDFFSECLQSNHSLFTLVKKHGGSIAAEHGIGLLKKEFLHYSKTQTEIQTMKMIKKTLDHQNLLNPGKIFDL